MNTKNFLFPLLLIGTMAALPAGAAERVALVIGNGAYEKIGALKNPVRDAEAVSKALREVGFEVIAATDQRESEMKASLREFARRAGGAKAAWVYFAGHGVQVDGENYLIPVDAELEERFEVSSETIELSRVLNALEQAGTPLKVVILDCCRDSPFSKSWTRSLSRGLAKVDTHSEGTIIAFAAADGEVALDGDGENSPYTTALVESILTPGLDVQEVFDETRKKVWNRTGQQQRPWIYEDFIGTFIVRQEAGAAAATSVVAAAKPGAPKVSAIPETKPDPATMVTKADAPKAAGPAEVDPIPAPAKAFDPPAPANGRFYNSSEVFQGGPYSDLDLSTKNQLLSQAQRKLQISDHDGWMNEDTFLALKEFQKEKGLPQTGLIDEATTKHLELDPGAAPTSHASDSTKSYSPPPSSTPSSSQKSSPPPSKSSSSNSSRVASSRSSSQRTNQNSSQTTQQAEPVQQKTGPMMPGFPPGMMPMPMHPGLPPGFPQPQASSSSSSSNEDSSSSGSRRSHSVGSPGRAPVGRPTGGPRKSSTTRPSMPKPSFPLFRKKK